ncbi:hypothetical protein [Bdellovibrio svalbardensis]|uniref:Uncharacterized protein n=1 Tax=Bdellovibrio svalbardensis TaxID=2972972 RepID=A0ABT6DGA8_9BACT|nr:hypothetical protein [Bdellovibrio svalbardensis]MDG0815880.1 hypothetical protein [Bdellovibrio svalbardensis]
MELLEVQIDPQLLNYRSDLEELSALLACFGYNIVPYRDAELPDFQSLPSNQRTDVSKALNIYLQTLKSEYMSGQFSGEKFVLQFLFRMGILPSEDLSGSIRNEKYIQIYSRDQLQIFRSLDCYERCSFTLEQLTTRPWFDLWSRDNLFYYALFGLASTALKFIKFTKIRLDFPHHRVTEQESFSNYSFDYKIKSLSGLTRQGKLQAALLIEDWKF